MVIANSSSWVPDAHKIIEGQGRRLERTALRVSKTRRGVVAMGIEGGTLKWPLPKAQMNRLCLTLVLDWENQEPPLVPSCTEPNNRQ